MKSGTESEDRAIERLIAEIDELDHWRDRLGRRVIYAFLVTFAVALCLLAWVGFVERPKRLAIPPGPKVSGVLHRADR